MCHNVNESLREPEVAGGEKGNDNTSYNAKIKNGINLNEVYTLIETLKIEIFRGDTDAAGEFILEKYSKEKGTFLDQRRKNNGKKW